MRSSKAQSKSYSILTWAVSGLAVLVCLYLIAPALVVAIASSLALLSLLVVYAVAVFFVIFGLNRLLQLFCDLRNCVSSTCDRTKLG